jgi:hypothetical protein
MCVSGSEIEALGIVDADIGTPSTTWRRLFLVGLAAFPGGTLRKAGKGTDNQSSNGEHESTASFFPVPLRFKLVVGE